MAIDKIFDDIIKLRKYMATILGEKEKKLNDSDIKSLTKIRANCLFSNLRKLGNDFETLPLKVIIECLKYKNY